MTIGRHVHKSRRHRSCRDGGQPTELSHHPLPPCPPLDEPGCRQRTRGAGGHRRVTGGHRRVAGGQRRVAGGHRRVAGGHRRVAGGQRRVAGGHRRTAGGPGAAGWHRRTAGGPGAAGWHRRVAGGQRRVAGGHRRTAGGHRRTAGGHRRTAGGHRRISGLAEDSRHYVARWGGSVLAGPGQLSDRGAACCRRRTPSLRDEAVCQTARRSPPDAGWRGELRSCDGNDMTQRA